MAKSRTRAAVITATVALALGLSGCAGIGTQTGPFIEEPTDPPRPSDDGTVDNVPEEDLTPSPSPTTMDD